MKGKLMFLFALSVASTTLAQNSADRFFHLIVGTYTNPDKSDGIYVYEFDSESGKLREKANALGIKNPTFVVVSDDRKNVYSVCEVGDAEGNICAYSFNSKTGELTFLNKSTSGGGGPCHLSLDKNKKCLFAGNYGGGSLAAIPINSDGSLSQDIQFIQHHGSSVKSNQTKPHVHATVISEDGKHLFVPDLGTDKINIYDVNLEAKAPLKPAVPEYASVMPGSGPRHFTFHPNGKTAYLIQEMMGLVTAFEYADGKLTSIQTIDLVTKGYSGAIDAADIHISSDGKFLYGSLRGGINEIVICSLDETGRMELVGRQSTQGKTPRNFAIDPTGKYLLVGNQGTDEIVVFSRNLNSGLLTDTGNRISVGAPVCLEFVTMD